MESQGGAIASSDVPRECVQNEANEADDGGDREREREEKLTKGAAGHGVARDGGHDSDERDGSEDDGRGGSPAIRREAAKHGDRERDTRREEREREAEQEGVACTGEERRHAVGGENGERPATGKRPPSAAPAGANVNSPGETPTWPAPVVAFHRSVAPSSATTIASE